MSVWIDPKHSIIKELHCSLCHWKASLHTIFFYLLAGAQSYFHVMIGNIIGDRDAPCLHPYNCFKCRNKIFFSICNSDTDLSDHSGDILHFKYLDFIGVRIPTRVHPFSCVTERLLSAQQQKISNIELTLKCGL